MTARHPQPTLDRRAAPGRRHRRLVAAHQPGRRCAERRRPRRAAARAPARPTGSSRSVPRTAASRSRARWTATAAARPGAGGCVHDGSLSARGTRTTAGPERLLRGAPRPASNLRGTDTFVFRARNVRTGEVCRGTVNF